MMSEKGMDMRRVGRLWLQLLVVAMLVIAITPGMSVAGDLTTDGLSVDERIAPVGQVQVEGGPIVEMPDAGTALVEKPEPLAAPRPQRKDYPSVGVSSRAIVWVVAQMHLFFGALVLAVPLFVLVIELTGVFTRDERYDDMAHEFMKISLVGFSITAIIGGTLALALFMLYPDLMAYMMRVFRVQWLWYAFLFFVESFFLYTYYYGWNALRYGNKKWLHLTLGLLLNGAGMTIMVLANSWATFMMAPSGVDETGVITGSVWEAMKGPLWNPINLHRPTPSIPVFL